MPTDVVLTRLNSESVKTPGQAAVCGGTGHERWARRQAYALAPTANFSRSMLAQLPQFEGVRVVVSGT
jgi:hypothetical protein